ncbi:Predicted membrane protein [Xanthomonas oryzae pv. oryzae KACC 10331]|uniref:Predicted membrane protein n=3 Tax=Xanthomonas oryzae pv. oryzae TaxID=64187 RepID=Q5H3G7_XANOR|nr:Predicted membrane protein [Xanthomonas oryzae pv. oryzae KACC 10331]
MSPSPIWISPERTRSPSTHLCPVMHPINLHSFLAFLSYFGTGLGVLIVSVVLVTLVTPHKDFVLLRQGNVAAATALAGNLIGVALPLHSAITHSVSLVDALIWGLVACGIQVVAYLLANLVAGRISRQITDNMTAAGLFSAGVSIAVGLINAAAITP